MTRNDVFKVLQVLDIIETKLKTDSNSCEKDYYIKLREELENKLQEFLKTEEKLNNEVE